MLRFNISKIAYIILAALLVLFRNSANSAFVKQTNEFTCAPVSSCNLISNLCPECKDNNIETLAKFEKTSLQGTTAYNLCSGLDKYFKSNNIEADIKYFGIKNVKKYKVSSSVDFNEIKKLLELGYHGIINTGIYTINKRGIYIRQWGHYANLVAVGNKSLKVYDPYDKNTGFTDWKIDTQKNIKLKNINDNEKYKSCECYHSIQSKIDYLEDTETAIINGIVLIKIKSPL